MRIIKIFIASSEELKPERRVLADMQAVLNNRLFKQGVILQLEFWEHLDSSMGIKHKQEEYNDVLRECDGCIVLFWTRFGDFTKEEFEVAYNEQLSGACPKQLQVLFKYTTEQTPELKAFNDGFVANYGDISSTFNTNDQLRLTLIEQVEMILANSFEAPLYTISEDDKVVVAGAVMDKIKVLNVYIAMADDMAVEQNEFMDLVSHINKIFIRRNMCLNIIKHNQNMGDLRECELCMTLYCSKFGDYAKEDLECAYRELQEGNNPRKLYVFFKDSEDVTPELREFKENFATAYGHFFCKFENVDTMRLEFLLQLEAYQNFGHKKIFEIKDCNIMVNEFQVANLKNISFANKNKDFLRIVDDIEELDDEILELRESLEDEPENSKISTRLSKKVAKRDKIYEEFDTLKNAVINTALRIAKLSSERLSEAMTRALEAFHSGDIIRTNIILDEILQNFEKDLLDYKMSKQVVDQKRVSMFEYIKAILLQCNTKMADVSISIDERVDCVSKLYEKAHNIAQEIEQVNYDLEGYLTLLEEYSDFNNSYTLVEKDILITKEMVELIESGTVKDNIPNCDISDMEELLNMFYILLGSNYMLAFNYKVSFEYLDKAKSFFEQNISDHWAILSTIYCLLSDLTQMMGEFDSAKHYINNSLELKKQYNKEGCDDFEDSIVENMVLSNMHKQFGEYNEALKYIELAIEEHLSLYDEKEDKDLAQLYSLKGSIYAELGDYQNALEICDKGLGMYIKLFGEVNYISACLYNIKGEVYHKMGDLDNALYYYNKTISCSESPMIYGKAIYGIGCIYIDKEEYNTAIKYLLEFVDNDVNGENIILLANTYEQLSIAYKNLKRYDEAIANIDLALSIRENIFSGKNNSLIASTLNNKGNIYYDMGDLNASLECYKKAISTLGNEHSAAVATYYCNISNIFNAQKRYEPALDKKLAALEIREAILGVTNKQTTMLYRDIAELYVNLGDFKRALVYGHKSLNATLDIVGDNILDIAYQYHNLGWLYSQSKDFKNAIAYYTKAYEIRNQLIPNEIATIISFHNLGVMHSFLGDYTSALDICIKAQIRRIAILGYNHKEVIDAAHSIWDIFTSITDVASLQEYTLSTIRLFVDLRSVISCDSQCMRDYNNSKLFGEFISLDIVMQQESATLNDIATIQLRIADAFIYSNNFSKSIEFIENSFELIHNEPDSNIETYHQCCLSTCNTLVDALRSCSDQNTTALYFLRIAEIKKIILGEQHIEVAKIYAEVGSVYYNIENINNALLYMMKSANIMLDLKCNDEGTAQICSYAGYISSDLNQKLEYFQKALKIREEVWGVEHLQTAQSYFEVGDVYIDLKDYMKALAFLHKSLAVRGRIDDGLTDECAITYNNIGYIYNELGEYQKALDNHQRALVIRTELYGEDDIQTANSYHHLGKTYSYIGDYLQALVYLTKALPIREQELGVEHANTIATQNLLDEVKAKI